MPNIHSLSFTIDDDNTFKHKSYLNINRDFYEDVYTILYRI